MKNIISEKIIINSSPLIINKKHEQVINIPEGEGYISKVQIIYDDQGFIFTQWATVFPEGTKSTISLGKYHTDNHSNKIVPVYIETIEKEDVCVEDGYFVQRKPITVDIKGLDKDKYFLELLIMLDKSWGQPEITYSIFDIIKELFPVITEYVATEVVEHDQSLVVDENNVSKSYKLALRVDFDMLA